MNLRKLSAGEAAFQPHQRRPEAPVHEGDLAIHQAKAEHVGALRDARERSEDVVPARMAPPAAADGLADNRLGQVGRLLAARARQDDAMLFHEAQRIEAR